MGICGVCSSSKTSLLTSLWPDGSMARARLKFIHCVMSLALVQMEPAAPIGPIVLKIMTVRIIRYRGDNFTEET